MKYSPRMIRRVVMIKDLQGKFFLKLGILEMKLFNNVLRALGCLFIFNITVFAKDVVVSTADLKSVWVKDFKKEITAVAISNDGNVIYVAVAPECEKRKDESYINDVRVECEAGSNKLYRLD